MKSVLFSPPRATRLTPRNVLLIFTIFSITTWFIYYLSPAHGWRKPPGRSWHPAVYNPPPSLNPPWWTFGFGRHRKTSEGRPPAHFTIPTDTSKDLSCKSLPGANDILVVIKTGATESRRKLPVHISTTLKCIPHFTIFGDLEETVAGQAVHDALDEITSTVKFTSPDFELYREQLEAQRRGRLDFTGFLDSKETREHTEDVALQKEETRALTLDRWKYLPILEKALERRGQAKWFVFIEADTAIMWANLLQWLSMLDEREAWYLGSEMSVEGSEFAHGGSGYILSNKALRQAVEQLQPERRRFDQLAMREQRGDLLIAKTLSEVQVGLTRSWPIVQWATPSTIGYSTENWCHPAVTYHQMRPDEIRTLWDLEQRRLSDGQKANDAPILHRDVFNALVSPFISRNPIAKQWDNLSGDKVIPAPEPPSKTKGKGEATPSPSFTRPITPRQSLAVRASQAWISPDACSEYCEAESECLQWSYRGDGTCNINYSIKLGSKQPDEIEERDIAGEAHDLVQVRKRKRRRRKKEQVISGWMTDRIDAWRRRLEPCTPKWITGNEERLGEIESQAVLDSNDEVDEREMR